MNVEIDFLKAKIDQLEHDLQMYQIILYGYEKRQPKEDKTYNPAVLNFKFDDLELTVRTINCLNFDGIIYVGDLVQMKEKDVKCIRGFGHKSLGELKDLLETYNLTFGMEIPEWVRPTPKES